MKTYKSNSSSLTSNTTVVLCRGKIYIVGSQYLLTFCLLWIGRKSKLWIIGIAIPLLAILLCSTFTFLWMRRRKKGLLCFVDAVLVCSLPSTDQNFLPHWCCIYYAYNSGMLSSQNRAGANRIEENALVWRIEEKSSEFTLFDLSQLLEATENFAEENRLGQGGFGPVYKVNKISIMLGMANTFLGKLNSSSLGVIRCLLP